MVYCRRFCGRRKDEDLGAFLLQVRHKAVQRERDAIRDVIIGAGKECYAPLLAFPEDSPGRLHLLCGRAAHGGLAAEWLEWRRIRTCVK